MHPDSIPAQSPLPNAGAQPAFRQGLKPLAVFAVILFLCFARPLYDLVRFALHSDLYSYILLVPFISLYLAWLKADPRGRSAEFHFGAKESRSWFALRWNSALRLLSQAPNNDCLALNSTPDRRLALLPFLAGLASLGGYWLALRAGWKPHHADYLACMTLALVLLLLGGTALFIGKKTLRAVAFPVAFLIFMVPFPEIVTNWLKTFLQHASAEAAYMFFNLAGTPVLRAGMDFQLPGFAMQVAPECSGIHSSLVLFITSLVAAHLFLRANWSRTLLVLAVIPLGIIRNGFRIFVLGELCVHVDLGIIDSPLHHRGGPVFFVISIIPFFLLLWLLRKLERRNPKPIH